VASIDEKLLNRQRAPIDLVKAGTGQVPKIGTRRLQADGEEAGMGGYL
jgi:hypothetical protein